MKHEMQTNLSLADVDQQASFKIAACVYRNEVCKAATERP